MPQTDLLQTDDMEEGLELNLIRFNEAKKEHADAANKTIIIDTSTFGGTTQSLPTDAAGVNEFFRRAVFKFEAGATAAFTINVPDTQRIFWVVNETGQTINIDSSGSTGAVSVASGIVAQISESSGPLLTILDTLESTSAVNRPFDVGAFFPGKFAANELVLKFVYARPVNILTDFPLSEGHYGVPPNNPITFSLLKNGSSFGECSFSSGSQIATFNSTALVGFVAGDILEIIAPASTDDTGQDISFTIAGVRP